MHSQRWLAKSETTDGLRDMGKRLLVNSLIIVWAIAAGIFVSLKPWRVYQHENDLTHRRVIEMRNAEDARDKLMRSELKLQTPLGQEEEARAHGYLGQGEEPTSTPAK